MIGGLYQFQYPGRDIKLNNISWRTKCMRDLSASFLTTICEFIVVSIIISTFKSLKTET